MHLLEGIIASINDALLPDARLLREAGFSFFLKGDVFTRDDCDELTARIRPFGLRPDRFAWDEFKKPFAVMPLTEGDAWAGMRQAWYGTRIVACGEDVAVVAPDDSWGHIYIIRLRLAEALAGWINECDRDFAEWTQSPHHSVKGRAYAMARWTEYCGERRLPV